MGYVVGIDLGTTNSAVAVVGPAGIPEMIPSAEGDTTTPSVVLFQDFGGDDEPLVGAMAKNQVAAYPDDVVQFVKRFMGDPHWVFDSPANNQYRPEEISALILKKLKLDAEQHLGEPISEAVITVPAYFDDARRTATRQAGEIAGLKVLRVLNEPTAAALAYGMEQDGDGTVLVYDLGGGTFDVTILKIEDGNFTVLATDGDRNLGGFDFDNALIAMIAQEAMQEGASNMASDPALLAELREKAEFAKKALTNVAKTSVQFSQNGKNYKVILTRDAFEDGARSLINRTQEILEDVLDEAGLSWPQIDRILLVGGSTRMPFIKQMVESVSNKKVELNINPDEIVAIGAAIQAKISSEQQPMGELGSGSSSELSVYNGKDVSIVDVTSQALSVILYEVDSDERFNHVVIPKNTQVPCSGSRDVQTREDNQTRLRIEVTQGDDRDPAFVTIVGEGTVDIPPYPKGSPVEVFYHYDIDQTVFVEVFDRVTNQLLGTFEIDRVANMSSDEVALAKTKIDGISIL